MKKFISLILVAYLCFFPLMTNNGSKAQADSSFMRVITEDTPFYKNVTDSAPLFYLPYTYYVKVLSENNGFIHVECLVNDGLIALDGYVPSGILYQDELDVTSPYLSLKITTATNGILYEDCNLSTPIRYVFKDRQMQYFGHIKTSQGIVYYVGYNDVLGYVKEDAIMPFTINNHPNELTFLTPIEPETPPENQQNETPEPITEDFFELKIIIIVCLIFAGLIALFIALKQKPKTNVAASYYDDNDYE